MSTIFPRAWLTAGVKPTKTEEVAKPETKIEARIDMSAEVAGIGKCPECRQPMQVVTSGASRMWACANDRITIPLPDGYKEN